MAFTLPDFNLLCDIYRGPWTGKVLALTNQPCNLSWAKRIQPGFSLGTTPQGANAQCPMTLLLEAGVDIRDDSGLVGGSADVVEVPSGSGRWYGVFYVDDIGKGFANEHRGALIYKIYEAIAPGIFPGLSWPFPIP